MVKRRPLPSPPPAPVESSDDEAFSSAEEEDEKNITPTKPTNPNPNPRKDEDEEDEDEEETEEPVEPEEEEEELEEEEEESDDEDLPAAAAPDDEKIPDPVSESGSEPDSDSDSDEPPKAVKPISSKPMPPDPVAASPRKPRDDGGAPFQRVWSLTDEIALLRGVLNYKANTGTIPHNISQKQGRYADFPDLVRGSLKMDASEGQLSEKIRRLKMKYEKATARSSPHFASPHDREAFELSAQIWGTGGASEENVAMENAGEGDPAGYRFLREAVAVRKDFGAAAALEALERIEPGKARALEEKFKKQKMASMKLHIQRMDLQKETFKAIMDGVDRS